MNINIIQVIFQIVNFTILLFLLRKYLYRPILKILESRAKKIHDGLEAAEKSIEEREKLEREKRKILLEAEKSAAEILEGARLRAQKFEKTLSEKADEEMQKKLQRADRLVATRQKQMETNLQKRFSQAVVATTESLLKDALDPKQQRAILGKQIQQLKKVSFS